MDAPNHVTRRGIPRMALRERQRPDLGILRGTPPTAVGRGPEGGGFQNCPGGDARPALRSAYHGDPDFVPGPYPRRIQDESRAGQCLPAPAGGIARWTRQYFDGNAVRAGRTPGHGRRSRRIPSLAQRGRGPLQRPHRELLPRHCPELCPQQPLGIPRIVGPGRRPGRLPAIPVRVSHGIVPARWCARDSLSGRRHGRGERLDRGYRRRRGSELSGLRLFRVSK